jgi:hypothetical protein
MNVDQLKAAFAQLPGKLIKGRNDKFLRLEENKPATFYTLVGGGDSFPDVVPDGYSSIGTWIRPIGTHFLGKRIGCSNISEPNSCYICEQIKELEETLTALKQDRDRVMKTDPDEGDQMLLNVQEFEKQIQSIRCQEKYAFNCLVKGTDLPIVYEAPKSVVDPIYNMFLSALNEDGINIFDPMQSTAFTVTRVGKGLSTKYTVMPSPRPAAIITGEGREERIKKALLAGTNFDEMYKMPTRTEQVTAWDAYLKSPSTPTASAAPVASLAEVTRQKQAGPVPMSHIGGKAVPPKVKAAVVEQPPEPEPEPETDGIDYGNGASEPEEQELETMGKEKSADVVSKLLTRLRTAQAGK